MTAVAKHGKKSVSVIAQSIDTYVAINVNRCRYLDGQRFLNSSLDVMLDSIKTEIGPEVLKYTSQFMPEDYIDLFYQKQVLFRDYLDGPERYSENVLPAREAFGDRLCDTAITDEQYALAQRLWDSIPDPSVKEYLKAYLAADVLQTSDVLTIFRQTLMRDLRLDPMHYYTLSSYAWDSALRFSGVSLELITDPEIHLCVETAVRGGCAVLGTPRYAEANNPCTPGFDPTKEKSTIHFFDFNGLYTSVMADFPLPTFGFRWLSDWELDRFDINAVPANSNHGYIIDCDLSYPESMHDDHDGFPLAPEHLKIAVNELSDYTRNLASEAGINIERAADQLKLCLTLKDKRRYVTHYRNLQFYLKHGLVITKIYRIIQFTQSPFLQSFMHYMGDKRREAKSHFFRSMYKSIPNTVFGK